MGVIQTFFGKAIGKEVNKRVSNITASLYTQNLNNLLNTINVTINPNGYDYSEKGFEQVGAVYECVDLIVKKFVACPWIVYRVKSQKEYKKYLQACEGGDIAKTLITKAKALEEVSMPAIEKLLENPNPETDGDSLWELASALLLLRGNTYLYGNAGNDADRKAGKWSELWCIPSEMTIKAGQNFMDPVVEYQMTNYLQNQPFPAAQIKHIKTMNPRYDPAGSQRYGLPVLKAYLYSIDILKNVDREVDRQVKNGGSIGLLNPENKEDIWDVDQMKQTGESLKTAYVSNDKLDRIVPVSIPLKWTAIGLPIADLKALEASDAKADDVYRGFHVPLQFRSQDTATYNNLPVANRQLAYNAIAPYCRKFSKAMTAFICTPYNTSHATYIVEKDFMGLPELQDDVKGTVDYLVKADFLTKNEKREVIGYGRSAEKGADSIWVPITQTPMENIMDGTIVQGAAHVAAAITGENTPPPEKPKSYFEYLNGEPPEQPAPAASN